MAFPDSSLIRERLWLLAVYSRASEALSAGPESMGGVQVSSDLVFILSCLKEVDV